MTRRGRGKKKKNGEKKRIARNSAETRFLNVPSGSRGATSVVVIIVALSHRMHDIILYNNLLLDGRYFAATFFSSPPPFLIVYYTHGIVFRTTFHQTFNPKREKKKQPIHIYFIFVEYPLRIFFVLVLFYSARTSGEF